MKQEQFNSPMSLFCKFCGKECHSYNSLINHEKRCPQNKDRLVSWGEQNKGKIVPWNKGENKNTNEKIKRYGEKISSRFKETGGTFLGKRHTKETRDKMRQFAIENEIESRFGHHKSYIYKGVNFISSYELKVAQELDNHNIQWEKPKKINYIDNTGKNHTYLADFYLPCFDVYLDPKNDYLINNINPTLGYSDKDKIKWVREQNAVKIIILNKNELTWDKIREKINLLMEG